MLLANKVEIKNDAILFNLKRLTNQIYKLLPSREENTDWRTPLTTITEELAGMCRLLPSEQKNLFPLLCKLEGLYTLTDEEDFFLYRRTIFECLNIIQSLKESIEEV